jgi:hypothetical protein
MGFFVDRFRTTGDCVLEINGRLAVPCEGCGKDFGGSVLETDSHVYGPTLQDARLICAAPDLYAALVLMVQHFGDPLRVANAAIDKAEGR